MAIKTARLPKLSGFEIAYFWANTRWEGSCLIWQGKTDRDGYGVIKNGRRQIRASRMAYALSHGADPGKLLVCHKCDNPACCSPAHVYAGTSADNMRDCLERGRRPAKHMRQGRPGTSLGELNARGKRTERQVRAIIQAGAAIHTTFCPGYEIWGQSVNHWKDSSRATVDTHRPSRLERKSAEPVSPEIGWPGIFKSTLGRIRSRLRNWMSERTIVRLPVIIRTSLP